MSVADEPESVDGDVLRPAQATVDEGQGGNGRAHQASLPLRRGRDELLKLRPAVGLQEDAPAVGVGERVDGDPVARLAGRPAQELPAALRISGQEPVEQAEGEPAQLELAFVEEAVGQLEVARRPFRPGRLAEAAVDSRAERPAHAEGRPESGRDPLLALEVLGIGQPGEAGS